MAKIAPKRAHNGANWEQIRFCVNARGRFRDSAPRGQGGGSPPCTYCPETPTNKHQRALVLPLLGPLWDCESEVILGMETLACLGQIQQFFIFIAAQPFTSRFNMEGIVKITYFLRAPRRASKISGSNPFLTDAFTK